MSKYLEANKVLKEKYQIRFVMGENPLAVTYDGADTAAGGSVVIREFFPSGLCSRAQDGAQVTGSGEFDRKKAQFLQEMRILAERKGLEGIADVHDVFEENGTAYCIMEHVKGISLEKYLSGSGKQFPPKRIKELIAPVMDSLSVLHGDGLIHRNISPDNLIFTDKGTLKLIGFGCMEGQISGASVGYAPIELYRRQQEIRPAADVYALCASVYRCIAGAAPQDAYERLDNDRLTKPSQSGIAIDPGDEAVLMMGLNIYEEKRFQTMAAFKNAFFRETAQGAKTANLPVPPQPVSQPVPPQQVSQPVPPQPGTVGTIVQTGAGKPDKKKKKEGSGGMTALVVIGSILVVALGISAFILGKDMIPGMNKTRDTDGPGGGPEVESSTETEIPMESGVGSEYEALLQDGDFDGAIDRILALDTADLEAADKDILSDILSRAVAGQYAEFESRVGSSQNAGDFDGAFAALNEEALLYDRLAANSMAAQYVDRQRIEDKRAAVKKAHIDYLLGDYLNDVAGKGDEASLDALTARLQDYADEGVLTQEECEIKSVHACARFVNERITAMNNAGTAPSVILDYIDDNLSRTGNNCQVLEFWDYFKAVQGGNSMDSTVRHASADGYLLKGSNAMNLTAGDISHLTQYELRLAIYEIFARHGRIFNDPAVNDYFGAYSWYKPSSDYDEGVLNAYEKYNLNLMVEYQRAKGYR